MSNEQPPYIVAQGPDGLAHTLQAIDKLDTPHYILYQNGEQQSLLKIEMATDKKPYCWHYDLWGRPATSVVKEQIAHFLENRQATVKQNFHDVSREALFNNQTGFLTGNEAFTQQLRAHTLTDAINILAEKKPPLELTPASSPPTSQAWASFWHKPEIATPPAQETLKNKVK